MVRHFASRRSSYSGQNHDHHEVLQLEQLTLGDFYGEWLKCKFKTKKIGSAFASALYDAMVEREKKLLTSDVFLSAILLDPR